MGESAPPPGWYQDYERAGARRWWDGTRWTAHVQMVDQPPPPQIPAPQIPPLPQPQTTPPPQESQVISLRRSAPATVPTAVFAQPEHQTWQNDPVDYRPSWQKKRFAIPAAAAGLLMAGIAVVNVPGDAEFEVSADGADVEINEFAGSAAGGDDDESAGAEPATTTTVSASTTVSSAPQSTTTTGRPAEAEGSSAADSASGDSGGVEEGSAVPPAPLETAAPTTNPPSTEAPTTLAPTTEQATTAPPATEAPTTLAPTTAVAACHPAYSPCLENHPGDALNCGDLSASQKPVTVLVPGVDPYGLDADSDGVGCESG